MTCRWYNIAIQLYWKTNRISYVACQMVPLPVTLSDVEDNFRY